MLCLQTHQVHTISYLLRQKSLKASWGWSVRVGLNLKNNSHASLLNSTRSKANGMTWTTSGVHGQERCWVLSTGRKTPSLIGLSHPRARGPQRRAEPGISREDAGIREVIHNILHTQLRWFSRNSSVLVNNCTPKTTLELLSCFCVRGT